MPAGTAGADCDRSIPPPHARFALTPPRSTDAGAGEAHVHRGDADLARQQLGRGPQGKIGDDDAIGGSVAHGLPVVVGSLGERRTVTILDAHHAHPTAGFRQLELPRGQGLRGFQVDVEGDEPDLRYIRVGQAGPCGKPQDQAKQELEAPDVHSFPAVPSSATMLAARGHAAAADRIGSWRPRRCAGRHPATGRPRPCRTGRGSRSTRRAGRGPLLRSGSFCRHRAAWFRSL